MKKLKMAGRIILAVVVAEFAMVVLITLVQENIFGGITWTNSPASHLLPGGAGTFLSAVIAGGLASFITGNKRIMAHVILTFLIILEMTYLITSGLTIDPVWFDVLAGASLIAGVWAGRSAFQYFSGVADTQPEYS